MITKALVAALVVVLLVLGWSMWRGDRLEARAVRAEAALEAARDKIAAQEVTAETLRAHNLRMAEAERRHAQLVEGLITREDFNAGDVPPIIRDTVDRLFPTSPSP